MIGWIATCQPRPRRWSNAPRGARAPCCPSPNGRRHTAGRRPIECVLPQWASPLPPTRRPCGRRGSSCGPADVAVDAARWPLDHIFLFRPLRYGMDRVAEAGNQQIDRWVQAGRELDTGSRAVAEVSLGRAAQDSVDIVTVEPHVQVLIQEIVAAQGTSITKEIHPGDARALGVAGHARRQGVGDLARAAQPRNRRRPISPCPSRARSPIRRKWPADPTSAAATQGL